MEIKKISVDVPLGWHALTQADLRFVFAMMALYADRPDAWRFVAVRLLLRRMGAENVCPYGDGFVFDYAGEECRIYADAMTEAFPLLDWLSSIPENPVRIECIGAARALSPDPTPDISFSQWLSLENLYLGYQFTQDDALLAQMAEVLYCSPDISLSPGELISVFYWWSALKGVVSRRFPNFFRPAPVSGDTEPPDPDELRRSVDAQIRALTKGDISKEELILSLPADRALTELDALAREFAELNRKYPQKNS